jgi:hypothetical protein
MKWLAACMACCAALLCAPVAATATAAAPATEPPADPTDITVVDTTPIDTTPIDTSPIDASEPGGPVPAPSPGASAPLVAIPNGCETPPVVSIVFVGTVVAKVTDIARYHVEQIRAGNADGYIVGDLVDIHYDNETQYLDVNGRYLVGAVPLGPELLLSSKVRESKALFGGNAVIGLTEKNLECPRVEDPVRTLHLDGTPIDNGMLKGLSAEKKQMLMAFVIPTAIAFGIVLFLVMIRWLFTSFFVAVRHIAAAEPTPRFPRDRRHHLN